MSKPTKKQTDPKPARRSRAPEEKRQKLLAAAKELFIENGFHETSSLQIASRAGVSEGILYHHFGSKQGLFVILAEDYAVRMVNALTLGQPDDMTEEQAMRRAFDFAEQDPKLFDLVMKGGPRFDSQRVASQREIITGALHRSLAARMAAGEVRQGDSRIMAELQYYVIFGTHWSWRRSTRPDRVELAEDYIREGIRTLRAMTEPEQHHLETDG